MKLNNEEKLIKFLVGKFSASKNNQVSINKHELDIIGLSEKEVIQSVYLLERDGLVDIVRKSIHDDLSMTCTVSLGSNCIHYFENRKSQTTTNKREWVRTYIPITISVIALLKSFDKEIITLCRLLLKLLSQW